MINQTKFRTELKKIMPGYKWTIHRPNVYDLDSEKNINYSCATGIKTAGFNRLSTLEVTVIKKNKRIEYEVKSSGFGKNAPWLASREGNTLAQALRALQDHYEAVGNNYLHHAADLEGARRVEK
jgi:hypothetical protein